MPLAGRVPSIDPPQEMALLGPSSALGRCIVPLLSCLRIPGELMLGSAIML